MKNSEFHRCCSAAKQGQKTWSKEPTLLSQLFLVRRQTGMCVLAKKIDQWLTFFDKNHFRCRKITQQQAGTEGWGTRAEPGTLGRTSGDIEKDELQQDLPLNFIIGIKPPILGKNLKHKSRSIFQLTCTNYTSTVKGRVSLFFFNTIINILVEQAWFGHERQRVIRINMWSQVTIRGLLKKNDGGRVGIYIAFYYVWFLQIKQND